MRVFLSLIILGLLSSSCIAQRKNRRTTTTTEASSETPELTLADREANLLDRELSFRGREAVFRMREEKLSQREEAFKDREDRVSKREQNIETREKTNVRSGSCKEGENTPPDYSVVRLNPDTMTLQDIGDVGTCSENMRFFASPDNETEGRCDCDYHQCSRPLVYSDKYKQCFWAWSQGPCEQSEWYIFDDQLGLICEPNPCPETQAISTPSYYFKNPEDGKCYKAGRQGSCEKGMRFFTIPEDPVPKCRAQSLCPAQSIPAVQRCIPGNRRFFDGLCTSKSTTGDQSDNDDAAEDDN